MTATPDSGAATWNQRFGGTAYLFGREPNELVRARKLAAEAGVAVNHTVADCVQWAWWRARPEAGRPLR